MRHSFRTRPPGLLQGAEPPDRTLPEYSSALYYKRKPRVLRSFPVPTTVPGNLLYHREDSAGPTKPACVVRCARPRLQRRQRLALFLLRNRGLLRRKRANRNAGRCKRNWSRCLNPSRGEATDTCCADPHQLCRVQRYTWPPICGKLLARRWPSPRRPVITDRCFTARGPAAQVSGSWYGEITATACAWESRRHCPAPYLRLVASRHFRLLPGLV